MGRRCTNRCTAALARALLELLLLRRAGRSAAAGLWRPLDPLELALARRWCRRGARSGRRARRTLERLRARRRRVVLGRPLEGLCLRRRGIVLCRVWGRLSAAALSAGRGTAAMLALRRAITLWRPILLWRPLLVRCLTILALLLIVWPLVLGDGPAERRQAERSGKQGAEEGLCHGHSPARERAAYLKIPPMPGLTRVAKPGREPAKLRLS